MMTLLDDGSSQLIVLDPEDNQALWVRVGNVYYTNSQRIPKAVWVEYQPEYMQSSLSGSMLIDKKTWKALNKAVRKRLRKGRFW